MPPQLSLYFLGPPQICLNNQPVTADRRKAVALLAYLAATGVRQTRDSISALLWPDYDQSKAFTNLRHTLWEVQQSLDDGWIMADRETIGLDPDADITLDTREFESSLAQGRALDEPARRIPPLSTSVRLYRNHFLTGFSLKDAPDFNEWAFAKSEEFRHQFARALLTLSEDYCALGEAEKAIPYARRLVTLDPLNESSQRQLMQAYIQAGQHSAALKQYQACEKILRQELGIDPQPETRDFYKRIRKRDIKPVQVAQKEEKRAPLHNLPLQLSSFIGREREQKTIAKRVTTHRLVTLVGAGGIGKTRLSLRVGEQILNDFAQGVWFVEFASLNDPALVPQAVSTVFNIVERSENTLTNRLIQFLQSKTALLILDNCEHLIDACAQFVEALLTNCPNLKILATSREALGLAGEALYQVTSLSLPRGNQVDQITSFEAIRLFAERAQLSASDFALTQENSSAVAEICHRLDGIPLAIELAAARVNLLSVEQIASRLHESFDLLTSNSRTKLARQQTLQASIEWSWNLLSEPESILLRRLSIFAGGWVLESAESVCSGGDIQSQQILDLLAQLVMKSLVVVEQESTGERRYHLLEMIRQYGREKLIETGEEQTVGKLHLDYFVELCERITKGMTGPDQAAWFTRMSDERENLRAALQFASRTNQVESGLYLTARLYRFWESFDMQEGVRWLREFIQRPESKKYPDAKARALYSYGWLLIWLQQFKQAQLIAQECLELFRACEDQQGEIETLPLLGNALEFQGYFHQATDLYQQTLTLSQATGYVWSEARAHFYLGYDRKNIEHAFDHLEKAVSLFRKVGDWAALANSLAVLGSFLVLHGNIDLAQKHLDEATQLWRSNKRLDIWENAKVARSRIALLLGDYEQAGTLLHETLLVAKETGNRMSYLWTCAYLGLVALREGDLPEAHRLFAETVKGFQKDGNTIGAVFGLEGMASLLVMTGKPRHAARLIGWADAMRVNVRDTRPAIEQADIDALIAACLAKIGELAFSDMYDEGQGMTLDAALALAFEER